MNRKFLHFFAIVTAVAMLMCNAITAFAAGSNYDTIIDENKTTTFDKYLVMDEGANVPNVEFSYSIAPGQAISYDADGSVFRVFAGVGSPTIKWDQYKGQDTDDNGADDQLSTVVFKSSDTTILKADQGASDYVKGLADGEKYAKHTATVDFSNVAFPEPGVYRYIITEDTTTPISGITYDADNTRVLDVYVVDATGTDGVKTLKISSYVIHAKADSIGTGDNNGTDGNTTSSATSGAADGTAESDYKSQGFTNRFVSYDLTFSKTVSGNQASRDKYFKFTVKISGALPNTVYTVSLNNDGNPNTTDGNNADATVPSNAATLASYVGQTNANTITTDENGEVTAVFYLQHGQSIAIRGLGKGTQWTTKEDSEDYLPSSAVTGDKNAAVNAGNAALVENTVSGIENDTVVAYTNTREGVVPTGVLLMVAPFAAMMLVGIIGVVAILGKKKHNTAE